MIDLEAAKGEPIVKIKIGRKEYLLEDGKDFEIDSNGILTLSNEWGHRMRYPSRKDLKGEEDEKR